MALRGHRTVAVSLPGRGAGFSLAYHTQDLATFAGEPSAAAWITGTQTVAELVEVVRRAHENGPVILVGHSFGGLPITGAGNAVPELIERIVYVAAQCPVNRHAGDYLARPEWAETDLLPITMSLYLGDPAEQGFIRVNWRGAQGEALKAMHAAMGADLSEQEFAMLLSTMQPDEIWWQNQPSWDIRAQRDTWGRIPRTYVRTLLDHSMPLSAQDTYISEGDALTPGNPWDVRSIASGHAGFLRRPAELIDILTDLTVPALH